MADKTDLPAYRDLPVTPDAPDHSAWGLWGPDDRLGTLNLLTPARVAAAARTVREGLVISLNAPLTEFDPPLFDRAPLVQDVQSLPQDRGRDETLNNLNTQVSSQWDGFRHIKNEFFGFYNGLDESQIQISDWAAHGIAGRGVLLDIPSLFASRSETLPYDQPSPIEPDHLRDALDTQQTQLRTGDILVLHTGWLDDWRANSRTYHRGMATPGLRPCQETLKFLWDSHCAAIGADNPAVEVWPPGACATKEERRRAHTEPQLQARVFLHQSAIALLGLALGELWDTGQLARRCRERNRYDFLLTSAPLNIPGGVASPSNVLAIL